MSQVELAFLTRPVAWVTTPGDADADRARAARLGLDPGDQARDRVEGLVVVGRRRDAAPDGDGRAAVQADGFGLGAPQINADLHRRISNRTSGRRTSDASDKRGSAKKSVLYHLHCQEGGTGRSAGLGRWRAPRWRS